MISDLCLSCFLSCVKICVCVSLFRQLWTIRGSDTEVYPFSKYWRPLFWIFVDLIKCLRWSNDQNNDQIRMREILPPHSIFHLNGTTCNSMFSKYVYTVPVSQSFYQIGVHGVLAAVCRVCVFWGDSVAMLWTVVGVMQVLYTCQLTAIQAYETTFETTCKTCCAVTSRLLTQGFSIISTNSFELHMQEDTCLSYTEVTKKTIFTK